VQWFGHGRQRRGGAEPHHRAELVGGVAHEVAVEAQDLAGVAGVPEDGAGHDFTGRRAPERYWLLIELGDTEICKTCPGLDEDLYVTAEAEAFVKWHAGQLSWAAAVRDRRIQLFGPSWLVRAFPTWNARSMFAHIKPLVASTARAAG
jgi:hypothetical protein